MYFVNDVFKVKEKWAFGNLYEINSQNKFYFKDSIETVKKLRDVYKKIPEKHDISQLDVIGNKLRQKFEILLYEFSKLLMIGTVEHSKEIIERIENSKNIYFSGKKTASDLIDEIITILNTDTDTDTNKNMKKKLLNKINSYKTEDLNNLKSIIKNLRLYQKVTMHPMSHAGFGQLPYTTQEIIQTIELLDKFEQSLKKLVDKQVV